MYPLLIADSIPGKATVRIAVEEGVAYRVGRFDVTGNRRFSIEEISGYFPFGAAVVAAGPQADRISASTPRPASKIFNWRFIFPLL